MITYIDSEGNTTQAQYSGGGINWDSLFGNAQTGANIFDQVWGTIRGNQGRPNNQATATGGNGLPSWIIWGAVAAVIVVVLYMIYKK